MSAVLTEVTRGDIVESRHHGQVAVCDHTGKLLAYAGDPEMVTYIRSAAKPIQAVNLFLSGAADKYQFTPKELAIMCSSHYGEKFHQETIYGILKKIGLSTQDLLCGTPPSISADYQYKQIWEHHKLDESNSDCSGKHCGFLSVCMAKGYDIKDYNSPQHPMQQEILALMSDFCQLPKEDFAIGVDGCGVPVHGLPLKNMAMAYARFANPETLPEQYREPCRRLFQAVNEEPQMLAGTNGFCTEFLRHTHGKFIGKLGAEAVYCIGVKDKDMGITVKIEDGNYRALYPAVMSVLKQLNLLTPEEEKALEKFAVPEVRNDLGNTVGVIRPAVQLIYP